MHSKPVRLFNQAMSYLAKTSNQSVLELSQYFVLLLQFQAQTFLVKTLRPDFAHFLAVAKNEVYRKLTTQFVN
jgi:hypothetical protein